MQCKRTGKILAPFMAACLAMSICAGCGDASTRISASPTAAASPALIPSPAPSDTPEPLSDEEHGRLEMEAEKEAAKHLWIMVPDIAENGVLMDSTETDDGARSDIYLYDDSIRMTVERIPVSKYGLDEVVARVADTEGIAQSDIDAREIEEEMVLSYPAYRLAYEKDGNRCVDLYVNTDLCDFRIHAEFPIDIPGMDADEADAYRKQTVNGWLYADIVDWP